ncbi:hypothetical protein SAMN05892883_2245 [Jatrophihabitans sp. GAS493]|uniref:hypothetical protein n=1 Tax=Jatrophihabitans sp. GAS493 TaxID=1907575 RepID=UPI000BB821D0|nr:hypothetical protein [Jatrophihabitans sp. GAS493]SOD72932.1 hypothetical protein SAMN05892883_2245 [Jatrophihabitans sp. GAS493]
MLRGRYGVADDRDNDGDGWWDEQSRWAKSGTVCAIGLVALLIVCGGIIAWGAATNRSRTGAAAPAATSVPAVGSVPAGPSDTGGSSAGAGSSAAPVNVTWLQVGLGGLPFSSSDGPATIRAGVPSGFSHTQSGAVLAAIQILGRLSWSAQTAASMHAVATDSTTPAAQAAVSLNYGPPTDPGVVPSVAAFQVITYSADQSVVDIALRFNGTLRVVPATMQWSGDDWQLAGAPGPLSQTSWAETSDLTGYVLFSGQPTKVGD